MDDDDVVSFGESRKQHVVESSLLISDKEAYPGTPFHSVGISPTLSEILRLDYNMLLPLFSSRIHSYHIIFICLDLLFASDVRTTIREVQFRPSAKI